LTGVVVVVEVDPVPFLAWNTMLKLHYNCCLLLLRFLLIFTPHVVNSLTIPTDPSGEKECFLFEEEEEESIVRSLP